MKGILLAGGTGSRLRPMTEVTNKHLLPVFDRPMIFFPLDTLKKMGVKDVLLVTGPEHAGAFLQLLGSGKKFGMRITYRLQDEAGGIAQALALAEDFAAGEDVAVILGDNIFFDDFADAAKSFDGGARIFLKKVPDPTRFGVPTLDGSRVQKITEKPKKPASDFAVTGLYFYDSRVFEIIKTLKPSGRGELEITDVNNQFIAWGEMTSTKLRKPWSDAGTPESLFAASQLAKKSFDKK